MENSDNLDHCMSLSKEFNSSQYNVFDFQSPFSKEGSTTASVESLNGQKAFENRNNEIHKADSSMNEIMHIQKPTEVFKSNCTSEISARLLRRLSFLKLFDPLHSLHQSMKINDDCHNTDNMEERIKFSFEIYDTVFTKEIVNKTISNSNKDGTLISLQSPMKIAKPIVPKTLFSEVLKPVKKYSQEEFCQVMKIQELSLQKEFSQIISEYEATCAEKNRELFSELSKQVAVNRSYSVILSEILATLESMKTSNEKNKVKLGDLRVSNEKLKIDINATKEDSCNMESAFSDIYKRYETSKSMIKNYEENKKHLTKNIESLKLALNEQESMNDLLKSRIEDLDDKAAKEIDSAKKSADTQITILEAQLKKCEIQIGSLENDLKQAKSNSDKFGSIYDDLMENFTA